MRYHDEYKRMLSNPCAFTDKMSFNEVLNILRQFHLLRPIISKNNQDTSCLANFLGVRQTMGLSLVGVHDLIQMGTTGLVTCHCPVFLSQAWCKHACTFAFDLGIISTYPTTMHPKPSDTNKSKGRKKKARHLNEFVDQTRKSMLDCCVAYIGPHIALKAVNLQPIATWKGVLIKYIVKIK